ncbi:myoD family inhibitor isoform X2 [Struthio camelus]|uniref:myoD family inhibitor isoform X2 n=1 Tax=Struthio camelus TaxID=8801 RepID=UPI003603DDE4
MLALARSVAGPKFRRIHPLVLFPLLFQLDPAGSAARAELLRRFVRPPGPKQLEEPCLARSPAGPFPRRVEKEEDETPRPSPRQPPAVAPTEHRPPARPAPGPAAAKKEKLLEDDESRKVLPNGAAPAGAKARPELAGAAEAVTCQPQVRAALQPPGSSTRLLQNGAGPGLDAGGANGDAGNGLFRPLPSSQKPPRKLQSHHSINSQGSKKSKGSSKSATSHIPIEAQEDCCVHCILSCLFCEFLTLCNIVLDCATCGSCTSEDSCICCCCCNSGECADCDLPCDMDCGIIDACCESADCLEICMECCGLCFSS